MTGESIKSLGGGAQLVTVLPSAIAVLSAVGLATSRLYPWSTPLIDKKGSPVPPGVDSILFSITEAGPAGVFLLGLAVLVGAILLRPFQIALVQQLEGYWRQGYITRVAIARHMKMRRREEVRRLARGGYSAMNLAASVHEAARRQRAIDALRARAEERLTRYPDNGLDTMPTQLGNILRRAETTAGERYGLSTVLMFPRLYPFLSKQLDGEYREQTNLLDTSAAFTLLFAALGIMTLPLAVRLDAWSLLPVVCIVISMLSYRGALSAAVRVGDQQAAAFDLHRFEMLTQMRQELPMDGNQEFEGNVLLSEAISGNESQLRDLRYSAAHPLESTEHSVGVGIDRGDGGVPRQESLTDDETLAEAENGEESD